MKLYTLNLWLLIAGLALAVLSGCAGQGVKLNVETLNTPCGDKTVEFSTDYQVKDLKIGRTIEGGGEGSAGDDEGCGGGYTVELGEGTTKDAQTELIVMMFDRLMTMAGFPAGGVGNAAVSNARPSQPTNLRDAFEAGIEEGRRIQTQEFNDVNN